MQGSRIRWVVQKVTGENSSKNAIALSEHEKGAQKCAIERTEPWIAGYEASARFAADKSVERVPCCTTKNNRPDAPDPHQSYSLPKYRHRSSPTVHLKDVILIPNAMSVIPNTLCSTLSDIPVANFAPTMLPSINPAHIKPAPFRST